jgi:hypothetical protein
MCQGLASVGGFLIVRVVLIEVDLNAEAETLHDGGVHGVKEICSVEACQPVFDFEK